VSRRRPVVSWAAALVVAALFVVVSGTAALPAGAHVQAPYGLAPVKLQTRTSGVGVHPQLKWKAVPGAAQYRVVVRDTKKRPYWVWVGAANRVTVSATGKAVPKTSPVGPRIGKNYRWSVAAFDATGKPVALSKEQAISA
jgi:hypothetical protein